MKLSIYIVLCIICLLINQISLFEPNFVAYNLSRIFFKVLLLLFFLQYKPIKISTNYILFIAIAFLTDIISFFAYYDKVDWGYGLAIFAFSIYLVLLYDCWGKFKIGQLNFIAASYMFIMILNTFLMIVQLRGLYSAINGDYLFFSAQLIYHITLWATIAISVAYYFNSYSFKSMWFLMGSLLFICADILAGAHYFYGIGNYILVFSSLMAAAGYFFFFNYFHTKEEPLLTEVEITEALNKKENPTHPA